MLLVAEHAPVNTGPFVGFAVMRRYASSLPSGARLCLVNFELPNFAARTGEVLDEWSKSTGKTLTLNVKIDAHDDPAPVVRRLVNAKCTATIYTGIEPMAVRFMKAVRAQKATNLRWLFLTTAYTANVARELGEDGEGMLVASEFEPSSGDNIALSAWRALMTERKVPLTSLSQGGFVAAQVFVSTVRNRRGDVTRESVRRSLRGMRPYHTPLMGTPYVFGPGDQHNPNRALEIVRLEGGRWRDALPVCVRLRDERR